MLHAPMGTEARIDEDNVRRIADEVRTHEYGKAMAALAFDVLSRQAEGRALFTGRKYVKARAQRHGVNQEQAASETGNLLTILKRGPESAAQRALVSGFAVQGLGQRLAAEPEEEREELLRRFVRHADWLETATYYVVYPFIAELMSEETAARLWEVVADAIVEDDDRSPGGRARNAARLTALAEAGESAAAAFRRATEESTDPLVAAIAEQLAGYVEAPSEGEAHRLRGGLGRAPSGSVGGVLRLVTGVAVLQWLLRALAMLVGLRREAELELIPGGVRAHRRTRLFGRLVRETVETHTLAAVATVGRRVRYPALHMLVGALSLAVGLLVGGLFTYDAVRSGETILLLIGAVAVLLGGGLDLALSVLVPGRHERVAMELHLLPRRRLRLTCVPRSDADRFLEALEKRIA